jgi:hypothetical protein
MALKSVEIEFSAVLEAAAGKEEGSYRTSLYINRTLCSLSADRDVMEPAPYYILYIYITEHILYLQVKML